ncbi:cupredoxin domain-containing protein [Candidatus Pacearchaeota archaeon]|nr:cupredoxin domain-containing protein [Candidatus Pacearchaeota archaeon]
MAKNIFYMISIFILIAIAGFLLLKGGTTQENTDIPKNVVQGEVQKVVLGTKDYNYYPNTIKVQSGKPVSITLDKSVTGCLRSFTIKDLGVSKYVKTPSETIDFTPTKKGTFRFACSMGMGYGTIIVE